MSMYKERPKEIDTRKECRVCLQIFPAEAKFIDLFQAWELEWDGMEATVAEDLSKLANIQLLTTDRHSKVICLSCNMKLRKACMFSTMARNSDWIFRQRYILPERDPMPELERLLWPKPIKVNINEFVDSMDVKAKQEVLSDDEHDDGKDEEVTEGYTNLETKIEPEELTEQRPQIIVNEIITTEEFNGERSSTNGDGQPMQEECSEEMESHPTRVNKNEARKRTAQPNTWKKNIAKKNRYSAKTLPTLPQCTHSSKKFQCNLVTTKMLRMFHEAFYKNASKIQQDGLLLKCCTAVAVKRKRPVNSSYKSKEFTTKFHIIADRKKIPVCQKAFLKILNIKKGRVLALVAKLFKTAEFPVDKRGGDHRSHKYCEIQQSVHTFMSKLKCDLPSDLNIRKLYKMYKNSFPGPYAKESYFRKIFNMQYNLGFGSPQTDICSTRLQLTEKIKLETNPQKKGNLMVEKRVHTLKAKAFFSLLKTAKDGVLKLQSITPI